MELTPRQISAFLYFGDAIDREDAMNSLTMATLAARGAESDVKKFYDELKRDPYADDAVLKVDSKKPIFPRGAKVVRQVKK